MTVFLDFQLQRISILRFTVLVQYTKCIAKFKYLLTSILKCCVDYCLTFLNALSIYNIIFNYI